MSETLAKRALFDLLRRGPLSAAEASLYPRILPELVRDGIARRLPDGGVELASSTQYQGATATMPPDAARSSAPPASGPLPTVSARVTFEDIAFLEELERSRNISRADAVRFIFERARAMGSRFAGSGQTRKAGGQ